MIEVLKPGLMTTTQDLGRPGHYYMGIPMSGGMDRYALSVANLLVGNEEGAAVLEAVFAGPELRFTQRATVAVTGADLPAKINGQEVDGWTALQVAEGDVLSFGVIKGGARVYIAVSGGIDVAPVLGSRSTYLLGRLGGLEGRPLQSGDRLPVGSGGRGWQARSLPAELRPTFSRFSELRMVKGLYWHRITAEAGEQFFADTWRVAAEADRVAYRFKGGTPLDFVPREPPFGAGSHPSNVVEGCYPYGCIQVPGGTDPIVLHRDAVSVGGYFMVGAVISADMDLIAQMQPNMQVKFVPVDMDAALKARQSGNGKMQQAREYLSGR